MILFLNGLCMGAAILMGMQYGAKDYDTLHRQISTTMLSGVVFSVTLTVLCVIFAVPMLKLIQVDPSSYGSDSRIPADHILGIDVLHFYITSFPVP